MICSICQSALSQERIEALQFLGTMPYEYKCFQCANLTVKRVRGTYDGLSGVSNLILSNNIGPIRHISQETQEISEPGGLDVDNDDINDRIS